jgi:hypothetical protein
MFKGNPPAGFDPLREFLAGCEVKTFRDGSVVSLGKPAPTDMQAAGCLIGISHPRDIEALTGPGILTYARKKGVVWVCNSWEAGWKLLGRLRAAGVPASSLPA